MRNTFSEGVLCALLATAAFLFSGASLRAANLTAASCATSAVQAAINSAADGDTVLIPDGTCTWTSGISTTKQIIVRAQNYTPRAGGDAARTVTIINHSAASLLSMTSGNLFHIQVSGIKFAEGTGDGGHVRISGSGSKVPLINDCLFEVKGRSWPQGWPLQWSALGGVIWNTRFVGVGTGGIAGIGAEGGSFHIKFTPRIWHSAHTMGAADASGTVNLYMEDSSCLNVGQFPDVDDHARLVMRYSNLDGCTGTSHGFTSEWGGRHVEYYNNTFSATVQARNHQGRYYWIRAGTGVFTDNVVNNSSYPIQYGNVSLLDSAVEGTVGAYPMVRQVGRGNNGSCPSCGPNVSNSGDIPDPVYVWNNTGARGSTWGTSAASMIQLNRDIFVNAGAKPGYSKYTYPHPLRAAIGGVPGPDTTAPSVPTSLSASASSSSQINLSWGAATDNVGVSGYRLERCQGTSCSNFSQIATPSGAAYSDTGLDANTSYLYRVAARDGAGNVSGYSITAAATTQVATSGTPVSLPEGATGIAAQYPGDVNIGSHPSVVFADDFESYASASQLTSRWNELYQQTYARIATEAGNVFSGGRALEFRVPQQSTEVANAAVKHLSPTEDVLFVRVYTKFDPGYDANGSNHNGIAISANYSTPGVPANGTNKFYVNVENSRELSGDTVSPGFTNVYTYHPEQRTQWGDHWYPDGRVIPFDQVAGDFGPNFVSRVNFTPVLNRWYCYELMVKANTPGQRDGRIAVWIDGRLVADYPNVRLRDVNTLKINKFEIDLHIGSNTVRQNLKWYDNVVAARSYIGPLAPTSVTLSPPTNVSASVR